MVVYFFKIDNDGFTLHEHFNRPNQTYTEQPHLKNISCFENSFSEPHLYTDALHLSIYNPHTKNIWDAIFLSYNSRVLLLLKVKESYALQKQKLIYVVHKQSFCNKSSEDDDWNSCFNL